ncbi:hypothetical protein H6G33_21700 [Calothrix sp. FACHB-1219]|uniref:hypothetical protein n=1 Tax=unclassified Calothrix TaxID=2619626 RepID=UPI0016837C2F|nr:MULTISPECIES: hypothetical protein [unclassified Calothrix]MBD2203818.1 hypothetical protein [Calothrix sp. FACHB-168]MBD2219636.1 hypothetical protein [Calothrix sp. FACHB-1219]
MRETLKPEDETAYRVGETVKREDEMAYRVSYIQERSTKYTKYTFEVRRRRSRRVVVPKG